MLLYAELRRTTDLCRTLGLTRDQLHALPADTVDDLLAIEQERQAWLAELRKTTDGHSPEDSD